MKLYFYLFFAFLFAACGTSPAKQKQTKPIQSDTSLVLEPSKSQNIVSDTLDENYAIYYVVIADTNTAYYLLHKKMFILNKKTGIAIDTMGRYYNKDKDLIALPKDDEDEIYAGEYYPRRIPSEFLSLEYLNCYKQQSLEKTIALVTGIYETEKSADSVLFTIRKTEKKAFKLKAKIYVGCMH